MASRERGVWRGEIVTVLDRHIRNVTIRDAYGVVHEVRKSELGKLREDDDRASFRAPEVQDT